MSGKSRVITALIAMVLVLAVGSVAYGADEKVYKWKFAGVWGPGHPSYLPEGFAKLINEKSGGRLTVSTYPGGQLYGQKELYGAVQKGLIEFCLIPTGWWGDTIKVFKFPDMPFLLRDNVELKAWLDGGLTPIIQRESEKVGLKTIAMWGWDGLTNFSTAPVRTLDDIQGKKWRVYTKELGQAVKNLGASPVTIGIPEVYQAYEKGIIDAGFMGVTWANAYKWPEVCKYITKVDLAVPLQGLFVNKKAFDALPPDLQQVIMQAAQETQEKSWKAIEGFDKAQWEAYKASKNNVVYELPEAERNNWIAKSKAKELWTQCANEVGPVGLEAMEIYFKVFPDRKP